MSWVKEIAPEDNGGITGAVCIPFMLLKQYHEQINNMPKSMEFVIKVEITPGDIIDYLQNYKKTNEGRP